VSTASRYCRIHQQRLQVWGYASQTSGSLSVTPQALRPARLQWLNMLDKSMRKCGMNLAKIAAFSGQALSRSATFSIPYSICRLEAGTGASPPIFHLRGPPKNGRLKRTLLKCAKLRWRKRRPVTWGLAPCWPHFKNATTASLKSRSPTAFM
jgi:hypothetical protein